MTPAAYREATPETAAECVRVPSRAAHGLSASPLEKEAGSRVTKTSKLESHNISLSAFALDVRSARSVDPSNSSCLCPLGRAGVWTQPSVDMVSEWCPKELFECGVHSKLTRDSDNTFESSCRRIKSEIKKKKSPRGSKSWSCWLYDNLRGCKAIGPVMKTWFQVFRSPQ
jgi:hypothetical protein